MTLNRSKRFCYLYAILGNISEAALRAGFNPRTAFSVLQDPKHRALIKKLGADLGEFRSTLVNAGLERLAFGSANDAVTLAFSDDLPSRQQLEGLDLFNRLLA